jgi:hypothetical protein
LHVGFPVSVPEPDWVAVVKCSDRYLIDAVLPDMLVDLQAIDEVGGEAVGDVGLRLAAADIEDMVASAIVAL